MANTVISLKKSATPSATPSTLANGELAINYADGKLFYKAANGTIVEFASGSGAESSDFGTVNVGGTLLVSDVQGDILTITAGDNIVLTPDAGGDSFSISAPAVDDAFAKANTALTTGQAAFGKANTAATIASAAFDQANTGGGGGAYFSGNNGDTGEATGLGDIFRVHSNTLTQNVTIYSGNNALAAGPVTVASGKAITIQTGARMVIA
jgi:hypothetical protein